MHPHGRNLKRGYGHSLGLLPLTYTRSSRDSATGKNLQTVYVINVGISELYERNFKTVLCVREGFISKTKHIQQVGTSARR